VQIDVKFIAPLAASSRKKYYQFTAIDDCTRVRVLRIYDQLNQKTATRQVFVLADTVDPRYRALILLAVFASLRWGELAALRRTDINLDAGTVTIARSLNELPGGGFRFRPPKTDAGRRIVAFPAAIVPDLAWHLARFTLSADDALIFTSPAGMPMRRGNFRRRVWTKAARTACIPGTHFHDLRHTGNNLTAQAGANLRELMERMGHSSTRAALIYLHATAQRQRTLADTLGTFIEAERSAGQAASGTDVAREDQVDGKMADPWSTDLG